MAPLRDGSLRLSLLPVQFEVSDDNESLQMLTRNSQIGEFYVMSPPQVDIDTTGNIAAGRHTCDMMIYDEERDQHVRIQWKKAFEATLLEDVAFTDMAGAMKTQMAVGTSIEPKTLEKWKEECEAWIQFNDGVEVTANNKVLNKDVRIVVARPFIEHTMHNVIMTVSGRDTGATLFGPADMQLSANTQVKTIEGHYTGHFKAVVTKPQNVLVMRDVACAGYVAGCNTRWFAQGDDGKFSVDNAQNSIQSRLSFGNDETDRYSSMLAFPCYEGQFNSGQLDTVLSVTTRLLPWEVNGAGLHASFPGGNAMFALYNAALQLSQVHYGEDMKAAENQDFISQGSTNNATCFIGPHRKYDPFTKSFMSLVPGQGHFGPDAIPGVRHISTPTRTTLRPNPTCMACVHPDHSSLHRTPAGAAASRSRSRPRATRWCRLSWRSTHRWRTLGVPTRRSIAIASLP